MKGCYECKESGLSGLCICHKKHKLGYKGDCRILERQYNWLVLWGRIEECPDFDQRVMESRY